MREPGIPSTRRQRTAIPAANTKSWTSFTRVGDLMSRKVQPITAGSVRSGASTSRHQTATRPLQSQYVDLLDIVSPDQAVIDLNALNPTQLAPLKPLSINDFSWLHTEYSIQSFSTMPPPAKDHFRIAAVS
jgi:hypothetical protein